MASRGNIFVLGLNNFCVVIFLKVATEIITNRRASLATIATLQANSLKFSMPNRVIVTERLQHKFAIKNNG